MKLAIVSNPETKRAVSIAKSLYTYLKRHNADVLIDARTAKKLKVPGITLQAIDVDIIITVGGDGTVLKTLQNAKGKIFSINVGKLGFLTETLPIDLENSMDRLLNGDYIVDSRKKIKVVLNGVRLKDCTNEVVLHTMEIAKIRSYAIYVDNELVEHIRADGIIVATPTGSTSYALSAGGPIMDPRIDGFVITAIAPFKLGMRTHVVPSKSVINLRILDLNKKSVLVLDGQERIKLTQKDVLLLTESETTAEFIRFSVDYYRKFREKII